MRQQQAKWAVICFSAGGLGEEFGACFPDAEVEVVGPALGQEEYIRILEGFASDFVAVVDGRRITPGVLSFLRSRREESAGEREIACLLPPGRRTVRNVWGSDPDLTRTPALAGRKAVFRKAYGGCDLAGNPVASVAYSLQKTGGCEFRCMTGGEKGSLKGGTVLDAWKIRTNYLFRIPCRYLRSGEFFRQSSTAGGKVRRDMVFRMLFFLFACFAFVFMPYISKDYGVTGDEFVDHRHAGYVLDYFARGDRTALEQPRTMLHLYGNCVQVITGALCRYLNIESCYGLRHAVCGFVGALGILFAGLIGLRWGGGLGGLLTLCMMFFTPRFFGHSMNNLKDVPFATGYVMAVYYTIRLFDRYPVFHAGHIFGLIAGIALATGTRSGGLVLYPMLFLFAGLFYVRRYGIRECFKLARYRRDIGCMLGVLLFVAAGSYFLSVLLWPFALQRPFAHVLYSLEKFTHFSVGLRTIFDGEQMMSNMLPWTYAPKYLCIGMPVVVLIGFFGYVLSAAVRRKMRSLTGFFLLFSVVFPVCWVIWKHSNLYGGIRHLLFVMPPMVAVAGHFWSRLLGERRNCVRWGAALAFAGLLALPVSHMLRNHPNEYVYFNEFKGGLKGAYGDYETDYYFNSLKMTADWFRAHVLPGLPKDRETVVVTQAVEPLKYYFRKDTNIRVIYSRYYEKYSKDWDYALFGNVYINRFQLKNRLFPPEGTLYVPLVDGCPMAFVLKRDTKKELEGFEFERQGKYGEALAVFEPYCAGHEKNEEVWARMGKLYYMTGRLEQAQVALEHALQLHPFLYEALYMKAWVALKQKDYRNALEAAGKMLDENDSSPDAWYLRANIHYQTRHYREAIGDLNRLLSFRPDFDRGFVLAGDIFRDNGDFAQAANLYEQALKCRKSMHTAVRLADVWVRQGKYGPAERLLDEVRRAGTAFYPADKVESRRLLQEGRWKEAGAVLEKMAGIGDDADLFVLRAMHAWAVNDAGGMKVLLERALELDPGNAEALDLKKKFLE